MSLAEIKDFVDMTKQGDATLESRLAVFSQSARCGETSNRRIATPVHQT
ncbi:hypothetical protein BLS995_07760 [Bifidobacterium longum subsp. suillum]|nr:hypothetical protein BLS995_07760 [Bifidobacterium longum subsp. suillum]QXT30983.1 hypothetical protein BLS605_08600 [Bifidobacterium longum subsp. suillum]